MNALSGWLHAESPWHPGEQALQARVGARQALAEPGRRVIRSAMPQQHRDFFAQLPFVVAGAVDADGQPWASAWSGTPGFVHAVAAEQLRIDHLPAADDPLLGLHAGQPMALLGIELQTRRRNRANGRVLALDERGLSMQVLQSFGNCPQYIHVRELRAAAPASHAVQFGSQLQGDAADLIATADTFFIATQALPDAVHGGADVSHRGGLRGFVRIDGAGAQLTWPDYAGNRFFNTLGNIELQPRAGLLFIDFAHGDLLHVAGSARIVWDGPELASFEGAQRLVQLQVREWRLRRGAWPLRSSLQEP